MSKPNQIVKVAVLDLYEGFENQGMRCIHDLVHIWASHHNYELNYDTFEVRLQQQLPSIEAYDIFISSGGPGSPIDSKGTEWEEKYFDWISNVQEWNNAPTHHPKKHVFFICHSFQLACRYFEVGNVCKRVSTSFGVFPVHLMEETKEPVFEGLNDPFYGVDSRDYQVIEPNYDKMKELGASLLAIEKERNHVPYERAIMAIRFNKYFVGTQFHPEADAVGMRMYLQREDKKKTVIDNHGETKWESMISHLQDPDKIMYTYHHILPNFLNYSTANA